MFREMRRNKQQLTQEETREILKRNTAGTLALLGDDGYPYSVPVSYLFLNGKIIFHGAKAGHKFDAIKNYPKASFSVIDKDQIVPEKYTSYFKSAIVFGKIRILEDKEEMLATLDLLANKYRPGFPLERKAEIDKTLPAVCMMELDIEHMTGKQAKELVEAQ